MVARQSIPAQSYHGPVLSVVPRAGVDLYRLRRGEVCAACGREGPNHGCARLGSGAYLCYHTTRGEPTPNGGGRVYWPDGKPDDWRDQIAALPPEPEPDPIDADARHAYFAALIDRLTLAPAHRRHLADRGLSDAEIERHAYRTLPPEGPARAEVAASLAGWLDSPAGTAPGLCIKRGKPAINAYPGLLIPLRDEGGRLVGAQLLPDSEKARDEGKYRMLSSKAHGSGNPVSVFRPERLLWVDVAIVTEGPIKAAIAADRLGMPVIALPGTSNRRHAPAAARGLGVSRIILAFDADRESNANVAKDEGAAADLFAAEGFRVERAGWDGAAGKKGVDDLLVAGGALRCDPYPFSIEATPEPEPERVRGLGPLIDRIAERDAFCAPNLGPERTTLTRLVIELDRAKEGARVEMPHGRLAKKAGCSRKTVGKHLKYAARVLGDGVRIEVVEDESGKGYPTTFVTRLAPTIDLFRRIAEAEPNPDPEKGKRNGHGGKRQPCPHCGSERRKRTVIDTCADCGEILRQPKPRIIEPESSAASVGQDDPLLDNRGENVTEGGKEAGSEPVFAGVGALGQDDPHSPESDAEPDRDAAFLARTTAPAGSLAAKVRARTAPAAPEPEPEYPPPDDDEWREPEPEPDRPEWDADPPRLAMTPAGDRWTEDGYFRP